MDSIGVLASHRATFVREEEPVVITGWVPAHEPSLCRNTPIRRRNAYMTIRMPVAGDLPYTGSFEFNLVDVEDKYPAQHSLYRVYGYCNASMSAMHQILSDFSFEPQQNLSIVCLADGVGSTVSYFDIRCENSTILFNALSVEGRPPTAHLQPGSSNTILYDYMRAGLSDLGDKQTIDYIIQAVPQVAVLTCDIEIRGCSMLKVMQIYKNILKIYEKTRHQNTILILKLNMRYFQEMCKVVTLLGFLCQKIHLTMPPCMASKEYLYCIAFGKNHMPVDMDADFVPLYLPGMLNSCFSRWDNDIQRKIRTHTDVISPFVHRSLRMLPCRNLPFYWIGAFEQLCKVSISSELLSDIMERTRNERVDLAGFARLFKEVVRFTRIRQDAFAAIRARKTVAQAAVDLNTRAHQKVMLQRYLKVLGMDSVLRAGRTVQNVLSYQRTFAQFIGGDDIHDLVPDSILTSSMLYKEQCEDSETGEPYPYWNSFCGRMSVALSLLGWAQIDLGVREGNVDDAEDLADDEL